MRPFYEFERPLAQYLFELAGISVEFAIMQVMPIADGGMGGLAIAPFGGRKYGSSPVECYFYDADGVLVLAKLNLDEYGNLFEIDIWKVDFSSFISWPEQPQIQKGIPDNSNEHSIWSYFQYSLGNFHILVRLPVAMSTFHVRPTAATMMI